MPTSAIASLMASMASGSMGVPDAHVRDATPSRLLLGLDLAADTERAIRRGIREDHPLGDQPLFDITTGTGDFIANGVISHNCYARPTHEYLDMGAGTDFDTKIVFKPKAAELLREAFDKPSWKGELVMFSGVTDCYQAIEKELQLTRQCLEVCLEYRNPVAIISKSALVERDVDLIAELAREAGAHLSVSLAWIDAELARTIEPWAASPRAAAQGHRDVREGGRSGRRDDARRSFPG